MKRPPSYVKDVIYLTVIVLGAIAHFTPKSDFEAACDEQVARDDAQDEVMQGFRKDFDMERLQRKIWKLEDRYQCSGYQACQRVMPPHDFEIYRELLGELERLIGG